MAFDLKEKIEEAYERIKSDDKLMAKFKDEPVKALETILGVDLPDDKVQPLIDGIKAKLTAEKLGSIAGGLFGKK